VLPEKPEPEVLLLSAPSTQCPTCGKDCRARIGLLSHICTYRPLSISNWIRVVVIFDYEGRTSCLFARMSMFWITTVQTSQNFHYIVPVAVLRVLQRQCNTLCTSDFVDDVIFSHNGLYFYSILLGYTEYKIVHMPTPWRSLLSAITLFCGISGPCARLSWPSCQLLSTRQSAVSYRIV